MVKLTQSLRHWLKSNYPDKLTSISSGNLGDFTPEMKDAYFKWLETDEGKSYEWGGSKYHDD